VRGLPLKLYDDQSGALIGEVTEDDVQFLIDQLEEEYESDTAYYLSADTLAFLRESGASAELLAVLGRAIEGRADAEVRWSPE
jgi:processive 1,2-diacylglycerol beta-glucosyltransferase